MEQLSRIYTLYMHINILNNKKYVGITSMKPNQRWKRGGGYKMQPKFYRAIKKYGWDNFKHEIILCSLTKEEAGMFEVEVIKYYNSASKKLGYNVDL